MNLTSIIRWITRIVIIGIIITAILATILIFLFPELHYRKLQSDLSNEIINQHYPNWKQVDLDSNVHIMLPESWDLQVSSECVTITDAAGQIIAKGFFDVDVSYPKGTDALIAERYGSEITNYQAERLSAGSYWNLAGAYIRNTQHLDGIERETTVLYLPFHFEYTYVICFFSSAYNKEVEAIAWSMEYT